MSSISSSTQPGSVLSLEALQAMRAELLDVVGRCGHPFARDAAAVLGKALDTRSYSESLDDGIRLAVGPDDPTAWDAAGKVARRIAAHGPAAFGLWKQPSIETIALKLKQSRVSPPEPGTIALPPLASTHASA